MAGFDLNALFQQAQQIQEQMKRAQEELARKEVTGTAGGGMVTVTANGRGELLKVQIDPKVVDPKDVAMLEDLVLAAVNSALRAAQQLAQAAGQRADVAAVTVIPADKGLEDFRTYSGFGEALQALKENPLPHVLHVRPRAEDVSAAALESLRRYLSAWPEVELVQVDSEWVMRFNAILEVLRQLLLIAAALLGLGVLAVIGNTIRLEIQGRRAEIEVTKLVGGSNSYVRRPFLYTGVLYGVGGALLAWGIVAIAVAVLGDSVATLARLYGSRYVLRGPSRDDIGILLGAGAVLGWLGAWISAARHLRSIEPRA